MTKWLSDRMTGSFADDWPYGIFRGDVAELQIDPLYDSIGIVH